MFMRRAVTAMLAVVTCVLVVMSLRVTLSDPPPVPEGPHVSTTDLKLASSELRVHELEQRILELEQQRVAPVTPASEAEPVSRSNTAAHAYARDSRIGVLVMACNRVQVRRTLDQIFKYRPADNFPVILSQDCGDQATANVIDTYEDRLIHIHQPDLGPVSVAPGHQHLANYYKISRHYKWALGVAFDILFFEQVVIVEDDLDISPDFFEYFEATLPILRADPSLYCVSAWNDNGKEGLVSDPEALYRTHFFPGLGWMLTRELWSELRDKWPAAFWDDWLRDNAHRRNRACIRPEISRTYTFGREGVSGGQYFSEHLQHIKLNTETVPFTTRDLSYLLKDVYDANFENEVYKEAVPATAAQVLTGDAEVLGSATTPARVEYTDEESFVALSRTFQLMTDYRAGVPRMSYYGVVPFRHKGRKVFLAPPKATFDAQVSK